MVDQSLRQSPLAPVIPTTPGTGGEAGVVLGERPFIGKINVRGNPEAKEFLAAIKGVLGFDLPLEPNTVTAKGKVNALWLGPDEWQVTTPPEEDQALLDKLRGGLAGMHSGVTDVGDGRSTVTLAGPRARDLLAKGCGLDLHASTFGPGRCAQSLLARVPALVHQTDDTPSFDITVNRNIAVYLWEWLVDAAGEYGFTIEE